jgi:hypothetical protein
VEVRLDCSPRPATVLIILEASSTGSINVLINTERPNDVERSCEEEIKFADPRPVTVEVCCDVK